jgi:salicylate hydroxylase
LAVEDGAILATLLGLYHQAQPQMRQYPTVPETLKIYESLQKARTTTLHLGSISNQHLYHLGDGPEQVERDRILKATDWKQKPSGELEPFIWVDVRYQKAVLGRNAIGEAEKKWEEVNKI